MSHTFDFKRRVRVQLSELADTGMKRYLQTPRGVNLSSNDYLGLATHPRVKQRMADAVLRDGAGSTGSRLLSGNRESFTQLERRFARWKGTEAALFFGSGYLANLGVLSTLPAQDDVVFSDQLNHASLIDGLRLSKARKVLFAHRDVYELSRLIERAPTSGQKFLITESVFSMDGDEAPLAEYASLCRATDTALIVDEAHAVGIMGARGSGLMEETGVGADVFLSINPAGKALGVGGAFVTGPSWAIDYLIQRARSLIFSTAPPPSMAAGLDAVLDVIRDEPELRTRLSEISVRFRQALLNAGLRVPSSGSPIIPVIIGDGEAAVNVAEVLQAQGYDVRAVRPPSVAPGTSRLRLSVNVNLDKDTIADFSLALAEALDQYAGLVV